MLPATRQTPGGSSFRRAMTSLLAALVIARVAVTSLAAPADVTCVHGNATYAAGEVYRPDACTTCRCERRGHGGGRPQCIVEDCSAVAAVASRRTNCRRTTTSTGDDECCATCDEPGCLHRGQFYAAGQVRP